MFHVVGIRLPNSLLPNSLFPLRLFSHLTFLSWYVTIIRHQATFYSERVNSMMTVETKQLPSQSIRNRDQAIERLKDVGLVLPKEAMERLQFLGEEHARTALATCIALGISPSLLIHPANLKTINQAINLVVNYHWTPNEYFYMIDFNSGSAEGAEADDAPQPQGGKVKLLALIRSYRAYEHNATQSFFSKGMKCIYQPEPVLDANLKAEMIEYVVGSYTSNVQDRVMRARFIPVIDNKPYPELSTWQYGVYLHNKIQRNKNNGSLVTVSYGLAKANDKRSGADIARTRAAREAGRSVTTSDFPVTAESAVDIAVRLYQMANQNAARIEDALRYGAAENVDDALDFVASGKTIDLRSETVKELEEIAHQPKSADPKVEKMTETFSTPEAPIIEQERSSNPKSKIANPKSSSPPDWPEPSYIVVEPSQAVQEARRETAKSVVASLPPKHDIDAMAEAVEASMPILPADSLTVILQDAYTLLCKVAPEVHELIQQLGLLSPDDAQPARIDMIANLLPDIGKLMGWDDQYVLDFGISKAQMLLMLLTGSNKDSLPSEAAVKEIGMAVTEKAGKIVNPKYSTKDMVKRRELIKYAGDALDSELNQE